MRRTRNLIALLMAAVMCLCLFAGCGSSDNGNDSEAVDLTKATSLADLAGCKIAAQAGTFHADALTQIKNVQSSTYPEFADLLTALKSGAIDGYVAEEPTAFSVCQSNDNLTYIPLKNNDTGFTATAADVGIAVGFKKGSELRAQINEVLATITDEQRTELMEQIVTLASGGEVSEFAVSCPAPETTNGVLRVGMECAYEPYNWTDMDGTSLGAVPISGEGKEGLYANGYDVQIAQYIANKLGMKLVINDMEFDAIIPALTSGKADIAMAGMTVTEERLQSINFSDSYATGIQVMIVKEDSDISSADDIVAKIENGENIQIGCQIVTTGYIYASDTIENGGFGEDHVQAFPKGADAIAALTSGKIDCVIIDNEPAKAFVEANNG